MMVGQFSYKKKLIALLLASTIAISGCSSLGLGTKADPRLTAGDENSIFSAETKASNGFSCAIGALGGATLGLFIGALTGDEEKALAGAVIGGAAGCVALAGTNQYLENRKNQYKNDEDRLNSYIADVSANTSEISKITANSKAVIKENEKTLANLSEQLKSGMLQKDLAAKELDKIDANISVLNTKLEKMHEAHKMYTEVSQKEALGGVKVSKLDGEIKSMNSKIKELEKLVDNLSSQRSAIQVG